MITFLEDCVNLRAVEMETSSKLSQIDWALEQKKIQMSFQGVGGICISAINVLGLIGIFQCHH